MYTYNDNNLGEILYALCRELDRISRGRFVLVSSMEILEQMTKDQYTLYIVGNAMFRWDGTQLIQIGGGETALDWSTLETNLTNLNNLIGCETVNG